MPEDKSTRIRKRLVEYVLPDANGIETANKPILDVDRLRRLVDLATPLRERTAGAPDTNVSEIEPAGNREQSAPRRPPDGTHRRTRLAR